MNRRLTEQDLTSIKCGPWRDHKQTLRLIKEIERSWQEREVERQKVKDLMVRLNGMKKRKRNEK